MLKYHIIDMFISCDMAVTRDTLTRRQKPPPLQRGKCCKHKALHSLGTALASAVAGSPWRSMWGEVVSPPIAAIAMTHFPDPFTVLRKKCCAIWIPSRNTPNQC